MGAKRFLSPSRVAAVETKASHEVMDLVRGKPALSRLVVQLRDEGRSWRAVQTAIEAEIKRERPRRRDQGSSTTDR